MDNNLKKVVIIGGGWYGCHIASVLKDKFDITIIEKNNDIFNNSSYYNQNRLHLGFHYCRNSPTRQLCKEKYNLFSLKYPFLTEKINNNYYLISNDSLIDFQTFLSIYSFEQFDFELIENTTFNNIDGKIIKVNESVINSDKAYNYFKNELTNVKQLFNTKVISYEKINNKIFVKTNNEIIECDLLLDCTYNQFGLSKNTYTYEKTISLLFKKTSNCDFDAVTIMDGNFSSLYPRDVENNIYTLTSVKHTPLIKSTNYLDVENYIIDKTKIENLIDLITKEFELYYPNFLTFFKLEGYFLSNKTKLQSSSDSRDITIEEIEKNVISVNCGKIYGIFDFEDFIKKYIDNV
jgi:hypothetical protein